MRHQVIASSFADPADIRAFKKAKERGLSDKQAFRFGDNGIGCWGDDCTEALPMCALPPEDMEEKWGSMKEARHKSVEVTINNLTVICKLADCMPHRAHITNGCGIDLNPGACAAFDLSPPIRIAASWDWV